MIGKTNLVVAFFVAAVLAGVLASWGGTREGFMQKPVGMPLAGAATVAGMGPYDGIGGNGWEKPESTLGSAPALTVGGESGQWYLADNKTSGECCPSQLTSDTGCLCLSDTDKDFMSHRGGNR
jgi:hypothetical protein